MNDRIGKMITSLTVLLLGTLLAEPAAAFRCGSKLVKDGMHEQEVVALCGEPTSRHHVGYALRGLDPGSRRLGSPGWSASYFPGYGVFTVEVVITEFIYNLGPHKLMRRLVFEGGYLVNIDTLGRGYIDRKR
jgi:hypothetical protein